MTIKSILTVLFCLYVPVGCGKNEVAINPADYTQPEPEIAPPQATLPSEPKWVSDPNDPNNVKIEAAIRKELKKPTGELTEADLEKVAGLILWNKQLTNVPKGLEKLTRLRVLNLGDNPTLTKAQIAELQKALTKCEIIHNATK